MDVTLTWSKDDANTGILSTFRSLILLRIRYQNIKNFPYFGALGNDHLDLPACL